MRYVVYFQIQNGYGKIVGIAQKKLDTKISYQIGLGDIMFDKKEYQKQYWIKHRDEKLIAMKEWRKENAKYCSEYDRQYHLKNRTQIRAKRKEKWQQVKKIVLTHYGNKQSSCVLCGESDLVVLSIDHISGGGRKHIHKIGAGQFYKWLIKNNFPSGYRTLCMNCQFRERERLKDLSNGLG